MFKPTKTGAFRHRVTIQKYSLVQNKHGQQVETYTDSDTVWAAVEPLRIRQYFDAEQINAETTTVIKMRYGHDINFKDRITHDGRIFELTGEPINPEYLNVEIHAMCKILQ